MANPAALRQIAVADARKYGVNPNVFIRQIEQESGFNPAARSSAGAVGIAQFMPATAKSYGIDPTNPVQALDAAARYDANELKAFGGDYHKALAAYNAGAGNADKWNDPNFAGGQTYNYVRSILAGANPTAAPAGQPVAQPRPPAAHAVGSTLAATGLPQRPANPFPIAAALKMLGFNVPAGFGQAPAAQQPQLHAQPLAAQPTAAAPGPAPSPALQQPLPGAKLPPNLGQEIQGNTQGEQTAFLQALARLAQYEGAPVEINSGYRSEAKQAQLYANRASNPNPVAPPGHSLHEKGLAADGTVKGVPLGRIPASILARFGLATVPGDPVHVQLAGAR